MTPDADSVTLDNIPYGNRNGIYHTGLLEKAGNTITLTFRLEG